MLHIMLPTPILNYFSPHEILYKITPDFNQLKVFGSLCYISSLSTNKSKFDPRASKFGFTGFRKGQKDIFCWILNQEKFLYLGMLSSMNMFFYIKGLKILAMKLTILTFMIKVLLWKINLFWVSHHKSFLHPVIMLKITLIMTDHESEDQTVLRQSSQVIFASYDNVDNDHESDI